MSYYTARCFVWSVDPVLNRNDIVLLKAWLHHCSRDMGEIDDVLFINCVGYLFNWQVFFSVL